MNRLNHTLPIFTLQNIYNCLINSYLNYGMLCWGLKPNRITKIQKKAVRVISVSKYNAHTDPIFKNLNILKIEDIATRKLCKFYQRYIINKLPDYFTINFNIQQQQSSHQYNTRHHRFMIPRVHHKFAEYTVRYQLPLLLNKNVECILDKDLTHSEYGFSQYI